MCQVKRQQARMTRALPCPQAEYASPEDLVASKTPPDPVPGHVAGPYTLPQAEKARAISNWDEQMIEVPNDIQLIRADLHKAHGQMM